MPLTATTPAARSRADEDRHIWEAFRFHSRTFSLAARFLPRPVRLPVAVLYLFCRTVDTIADERVLEVGTAEALGELDDVEQNLAATLNGTPPPHMLWERLAQVDAAYPLHRDALFELIAGARWDLEGETVDTEADLIHYSNLVGGCVGAMMLPFLLDRPERADELEQPARALGIAMQVTNIVRDVGADARELGRTYIPAAWLRAEGITPADLRGGPAPDAYPDVLEAMMAVAERYFDEGMNGIGALPIKVRTGIRSAACMYRGILNEVRALGYANLDTRAYVPFWRKLRLVVSDNYAGRRARLLA